jgi:hypothetical protein
MKRLIQIASITLVCIGVYAGMRALPVEPCEFLHYGDYVNAEGVIEGCGYEETEFFHMGEIRFPIVANLTPLEDPQLGEPSLFKLTLFTTTGKPIQWEQIAVSHTERIHALVVDPSLNDYQHIHPQPAGPAGHYLFEMTPRHPGPYRVYLDFIPLINSRRTLLQAGFEVPGTPQPATFDQSKAFKKEQLRFTFIPETEGEAVTGKELRFRLSVEHITGGETRFSPVMDSYAHLVAFDSAGTGFAHLHPLNPFIEGQDPLNPDLQFTMQFDQPGSYRIWAQVIVNGQQIFAPFDLSVKSTS